MPFYHHYQDIRTSQQPQVLSPYSDRSSYKVAHPIAQCALRTHVLDAALLFTHPAQDYFSSDKHQRQHPQLLSPLSPVVESSSLIIPAPATKAKASSSSRRTRPSNAFMLFRSDYVRQNKHIGRRQQELSILAACAWRALGTDGQTGWYEKAAMARDQYDTTNKKESKPAARQRQRPYRPRGNGRDEDVVRAETGRSVRETYATVGPHSGLSRRRMRKNSDESLSPSTLSVQPTTTNTTVRSSTTIMASPSFIASPHHHHHRHHYHHRCTNRSEESTILPTSVESDITRYGAEGSNVRLWSGSGGGLDYVFSAPISVTTPTASDTRYDVRPRPPQEVAGPSPYPSPVSASDWTDGPGFDESQGFYNLSSAYYSTTDSGYNRSLDENSYQLCRQNNFF